MERHFHQTPLGKLEFFFRSEDQVSVYLHDFKFEGWPFHYFSVSFHQVKRTHWRMNQHKVLMIDDRLYSYDRDLIKRLAEAVRGAFLEWWARNDIEVTRAALLEEKKWLSGCIENERHLLESHRRELIGVEERLSAMENLEEDVQASEDVVGALLG